MLKNITTRTLVFLGALAAVSAVTQLIHLGYQSPQWGMWIDVVAVSWIIAFFLFGFRASFIVSLLGALVITLFAPDTWLGASMKWLATIPVIFSLYLYPKIDGKKSAGYKTFTFLFIPLILGIIIRCLIIIPVNYYYAIPIWTKMSPSQAMAAIPWYIIAGFNALQSLIDVFLAWLAVYRFKLSRYSKI